MEAMEEKILKILNDMEGLSVSSDQRDENLLDLGMDSIMFIQIIVALEDEFHCEIPDEKLLVTEMDTLQKMLDVLCASLQVQAVS
ncbi:MAG: acyl carrier protein [Clostridia bacterium]|nr:acyl carrier protein [Clostridia bacterium]